MSTQFSLAYTCAYFYAYQLCAGENQALALTSPLRLSNRASGLVNVTRGPRLLFWLLGILLMEPPVTLTETHPSNIHSVQQKNRTQTFYHIYTSSNFVQRHPTTPVKGLKHLHYWIMLHQHLKWPRQKTPHERVWESSKYVKREPETRFYKILRKQPTCHTPNPTFILS